MRYIVLREDDGGMFETEINPVDYDFFQRHLGTFKRMWNEQGKQFWVRFVMTFRSYNCRFGCIKTDEATTDDYVNIVDGAFIYIHEQFVDGKCSQAKNCVMDIATVAQNKQKLQFLDPGNYSKNPFYAKDTRDVYRRLFGTPDNDMSYLKAIALLPLYLKFGGSVCICLRRWLDAQDMAEDDESYWQPMTPKEETQKKGTTHINTAKKPDVASATGTSATHHRLKDNIFLKDWEFKALLFEKLEGSKVGPVSLEGWPQDKNPRFHDPHNPLYNPNTDHSGDWRHGLDYLNWIRLIEHVSSYYLKGRPPKLTIPEEFIRDVEISQNNDSGTESKLLRYIVDEMLPDTQDETTEDFRVIARAEIVSRCMSQQYGANLKGKPQAAAQHKALCAHSHRPGSIPPKTQPCPKCKKPQIPHQHPPSRQPVQTETRPVGCQVPNMKITLPGKPGQKIEVMSSKGKPMEIVEPQLPAQTREMATQAEAPAIALDTSKYLPGRNYTLEYKNGRKCLATWMGEYFQCTGCCAGAGTDHKSATKLSREEGGKILSVTLSDEKVKPHSLQHQINVSGISTPSARKLATQERLRKKVLQREMNASNPDGASAGTSTGVKLEGGKSSGTITHLSVQEFLASMKTEVKVSPKKKKSKQGDKSKNDAPDPTSAPSAPRDVNSETKKTSNTPTSDQNSQTIPNINPNNKANKKLDQQTNNDDNLVASDKYNIKDNKESSDKNEHKFDEEETQAKSPNPEGSTTSEKCSSIQKSLSEIAEPTKQKEDLVEPKASEKDERSGEENEKSDTKMKAEHKIQESDDENEYYTVKSTKDFKAEDFNKAVADFENGDMLGLARATCLLHGKELVDLKTQKKEPKKKTSAKLKSCSCCGSTEPKAKTYKKCQKCKEEGVKDVRYYCGRDCQVKDWTEKHKVEHKEKKLTEGGNKEKDTFMESV